MKRWKITVGKKWKEKILNLNKNTIDEVRTWLTEEYHIKIMPDTNKRVKSKNIFTTREIRDAHIVPVVER